MQENNIIKPTGWNRPSEVIPPEVLYWEELFLAAETFCVKKDPRLLLNILEILKPKEQFDYFKVSSIENTLRSVLSDYEVKTLWPVNKKRWIEYRLELINFHKIWYEIEDAVRSKAQGLDAEWSKAFLFQDMANQLGHIIESYRDMIPPNH